MRCGSATPLGPARFVRRWFFALDQFIENFFAARCQAEAICSRARLDLRFGEVTECRDGGVNQLFEASSASRTLLAADIQRYFRDINVLHQHAAIQPNSGDEAYGRVLAGLDPNSEIV